MALPRGIEPLFQGWKPCVLTDRRRERYICYISIIFAHAKQVFYWIIAASSIINCGVDLLFQLFIVSLPRKCIFLFWFSLKNCPNGKSKDLNEIALILKPLLSTIFSFKCSFFNAVSPEILCPGKINNGSSNELP